MSELLQEPGGLVPPGGEAGPGGVRQVVVTDLGGRAPALDQVKQPHADLPAIAIDPPALDAGPGALVVQRRQATLRDLQRSPELVDQAADPPLRRRLFGGVD